MTIYYLANAYSPHVRHWVEKCADNGIIVHIFTIHTNGPADLNVPIHYLGSNLFKRFKVLNYIVAGLKLRSLKKKYNLKYLHAHNSSGYGLAAYLSGSKYLLTTYGSEILQSNKKSPLYRFILKKVLWNAERISSTSTGLRDFIISNNLSTKERIHNFSLGVKSHFICTNNKIGNDKFIIFSNRRMMNLYNIDEIIIAFSRFLKKHPRSNSTLILLEGDSEANSDYIKKIKTLIKNYKLQNNIKTIKGFVSESILLENLKSATCTISIPNSDQLSSSILESMACGTLPILRDLDAYNVFKGLDIVEFLDNSLEDTLSNVYLNSQNLIDKQKRMQLFIRNLNLQVNIDINYFYSSLA